MTGLEQAPTRAAVLELKKEQAVVREAYVFLDEKRLLLASELLRQLDIHRRLAEELDRFHARAAVAMQAAIEHHGLDGLQVYPAASLEGACFAHSTRNFMGVTLVETGLDLEDVSADHAPPSSPSGQAEYCRQLFRDILARSAVIAGVSANLYRLLAEYRMTERRSRALENIILPEIEELLREMSTHLEELDLEDAIRVRFQSLG